MENNFHKQFAKIIAKAWSDPNFKEDLMKNPKDIFHAEGVDFPNTINLTVVENTDTHYYIVLPKKPEGHLIVENVESITAGALCEYICWPPGCCSSVNPP